MPRLVPVVRSPDAERPEPELPIPSRDAGTDGKRSEEATLLKQGIDARARAEAYSYFKRHPKGRYTNDISRLMRTRPR